MFFDFTTEAFSHQYTYSLPLFQSAVGLFQSKVKVHVVLFANRGSDTYNELKERVGALAPHYVGKVFIICSTLIHSLKAHIIIEWASE